MIQNANSFSQKLINDAGSVVIKLIVKIEMVLFDLKTVIS